VCREGARQGGDWASRARMVRWLGRGRADGPGADEALGGCGSGDRRRDERRGRGQGREESMRERARGGREELRSIPFIEREEERESRGGSNGAGILQMPSMAAFNGGEHGGGRENGGFGFPLGDERTGKGRAWRRRSQGRRRRGPRVGPTCHRERGEEVGAAGRLGLSEPKWPTRLGFRPFFLLLLLFFSILKYK
jgi:hypothetical protein